MQGEPLPDRVSVEIESRFFWPQAKLKNLGVMFQGRPGVDIVEFCVSGGWARKLERDEAGNIRPNVTGSGPRIKVHYGTVKVKWIK